MPRGNSTKPPSYRLHKASQQAVCTIKGRDHYLGAWMSPESRLKYERLITAWMAGEPAPLPEASPADCTVAELCVMYLRWAETHYVKDGAPTSELVNVKRAIRCLTGCYAALPVNQFSPLKLKACRDRLIQDGLCRSNVNRYRSIITRIIAYGVEQEMVEGNVWHSLHGQAAPARSQRGPGDGADRPGLRRRRRGDLALSERTLPDDGQAAGAPGMQARGIDRHDGRGNRPLPRRLDLSAAVAQDPASRQGKGHPVRTASPVAAQAVLARFPRSTGLSEPSPHQDQPEFL